jgi:Protein of unknown function (DUF760)
MPKGTISAALPRKHHTYSGIIGYTQKNMILVSLLEFCGTSGRESCQLYKSKQSMAFNPENANFLNSGETTTDVNALLKYLQHQSPEVLERVARSVSAEVKQIISHNVQGLVGVLPQDGFNVKISTDRENLAGMLASAMLTGYFLRQMEQRMELDDSIASSFSLADD